MQLGLRFPMDNTMQDPGAVRAFAEMAEGAGYQYLTTADHVLGADIRNRPDWSGPYTIDDAWREPMVLLGFMAACTRTLRLGTAIVILPQRQTALVAKQMAELDMLCAGRSFLGAGIGWNKVEFQALGIDFANRGRRTEEQILLLRRLWTERTLTFHGEFHDVEEAGLNTWPVQRPIPIWMGGSAEPAVRRIARIADGWIPSSGSAADFPEHLRTFQEWVREGGRDPSTVAVVPRMLLKAAEADQWPDVLHAWESTGASHLSLSTNNLGIETAHEHIGLFREFADRVGMKPA